MMTIALPQGHESMTVRDEPMLERMKSMSNPLTMIALFSAKKAEDKEEFLGGAFALTKYEDKGIVINFAEIFRKLRGLFRK